MLTIFFERSGGGAKADLEAFRATLQDSRGCQGVRLLASTQERGLYLLVSTWTPGSEPPAAPEGTKVWMFRDAEG